MTETALKQMMLATDTKVKALALKYAVLNDRSIVQLLDMAGSGIVPSFTVGIVPRVDVYIYKLNQVLPVTDWALTIVDKSGPIVDYHYYVVRRNLDKFCEIPYNVEEYDGKPEDYIEESSTAEAKLKAIYERGNTT